MGAMIRNADRWGRWSHCGLFDPQSATVIEARAFHGVVESPLLEFIARTSHYEIVVLDVPKPELCYAWARRQVGAKYDYWSVIGNLFRENWQDNGRYNCTELLEQALIAGGADRFRSKPWMLSPNLSWQVK